MSEFRQDFNERSQREYLTLFEAEYRLKCSQNLSTYEFNRLFIFLRNHYNFIELL